MGTTEQIKRLNEIYVNNNLEPITEQELDKFIDMSEMNMEYTIIQTILGIKYKMYVISRKTVRR